MEPEAITSFKDPRFEWDQGAPEHTFESDGCVLVVTPTPRLDYWSRTFYEPELIKHDAQCLLAPVEHNREATLTTAFTLVPRAQFDQAGIMVLVDENTWVKAGIEFTGVEPLGSLIAVDLDSCPSLQTFPRKRAGPGSCL